MQGQPLATQPEKNRQNPNIAAQFGQTQKTTLKVFPDETKLLSAALSGLFFFFATVCGS